MNFELYFPVGGWYTLLPPMLVDDCALRDAFLVSGAKEIECLFFPASAGHCKGKHGSDL